MKRLFGVILIVFFLGLYLSGTPINKLDKEDPSDQVDNYIAAQMDKFHITGLTLAVVKDGKVIKSGGYGLSNVEYHLPAREKNVFQIASVSKQFTATAIMMLVEEHKINLDDKITDYLSDLPLEWQNITVRHLLTHTSGIVNYTALPEMWERNLYPASKEEVIKLATKYPLEFTPNDIFKYCNTGYFLLGMIIEKASGKSYGDFLDERIFQPLNMNSTRVNDLNRLVMNRADGYLLIDRVYNARSWDPSWAYAAGALNSTVLDLAKWDAALYTEELLSKESLEQMWTPVTLNDGTVFPYGFGWLTGKFNNHRIVLHNGNLPGFSSHISRFINDRITVIVLINAVPSPVDEIAFNVANFYIDGLLPSGHYDSQELNRALHLDQFSPDLFHQPLTEDKR